MNTDALFTLTGTAATPNPARMLEEIAEHFVEHAEVSRTAEEVLMTSKLGTARMLLSGGELQIELACPSEQALMAVRTSLAEHMFYFAGEDPLDLAWSARATQGIVRNLHEVTVVSAQDVTPLMRRVTFALEDVSPFLGGDMHVRILVPPPGRAPVWPRYRGDGRIAWPQGEDALLVRPYTIRGIDAERRHVWVDFLQHPAPGVSTPGADFARDARPGDKAAFLGPGSGKVPAARSILLIGDESALPAIARIAEEVPAGTLMRAIIEVADAAEEQPLTSEGTLDVRWLHRRHYGAAARDVLATAALAAIASMEPQTFVWAACEKADIRRIRAALTERGHDRRLSYVAWYWER